MAPPLSVVAVGKVLAKVSTATLFAPQRRLNDQRGGLGGELDLENTLELFRHDDAVHPGGHRRYLGDSVAASLEAGPVAEDADVFPHDPAQPSQQFGGRSLGGAASGLGDKTGKSCFEVSLPGIAAFAGPGGGGQPGPGAEDDGLGERVAAQAIGPVQPARGLAGREEAGHRGRAGRVDAYPADHEMGRRGQADRAFIERAAPA